MINRHLPERWGYAYFTEQGVNHSSAAVRRHPNDVEEGPRDPLWPVKEALAQVYEAEKAYDALYGACVRRCWGLVVWVDGCFRGVTAPTHIRAPPVHAQGKASGTPTA